MIQKAKKGMLDLAVLLGYCYEYQEGELKHLQGHTVIYFLLYALLQLAETGVCKRVINT